MYIEIEQGTTLPSCFIDDEIVECVMMRDDQVFLDVHEIIDVDASEFGELLTGFFEKGGDLVAFLDLLIISVKLFES